MKLLLKFIYVVLVLVFAIYAALPSPEFPEPPPGALQSSEPADTETPLRRAYFVNQSREEVIAHYMKEFDEFYTVRLNYPPEEAQRIIRDQTRSYYLEELVHPFRESIYINGFIPQVRKDAVVIGGQEYYQKITVRYVPSSAIVRIAYVALVSLVGYFVIASSALLLGEYLVWGHLLWKQKRQ